MSNVILTYFLDVAGFVLAIVAAAAGLHAWVRRTTRDKGLSWRVWVLLLGLVTIGSLVAIESGRRESERLEKMVAGLGPTYAAELQRLGHGRITAETSPDDKTYLTLIDAEVRWLKLNPSVADIYTFGKNADGQTVLLVDSETDYDNSGAIDDEREERTDIGETYDEDAEEIDAAFAGNEFFVPTPVADRWGTWVSSYTPMRDDSGKVIGVLGIDYPADGWVRGILWHRGAMLGLTAFVAAILIGSIAITTALRAEIERRKRSEAERERLQQKLLEASRQAGKAEIAIGVLHNVGNVLNSVNVAAGVITDKTKATDLRGLTKAAELMQTNRSDLGTFFASDLGSQIPDFLGALSKYLSDEQNAVMQEIDQLNRGIDHIKQIVQAQQAHAKDSTVTLPTEPAALFEEALVLGIGADAIALEITREFQEMPEKRLDRHKVLQILINLLSNARQAMIANDGTKRLTLRLSEVENADGRFLRFDVQDTGDGIAPENLSRIFQHGFTTRSNGHGFGLHSSANAAAEMHGTLTAHSDGTGKGARFTLLVPVQTAEVETGIGEEVTR